MDAQTRKTPRGAGSRPTRSERVKQDSPAYRVIQKGGGLSQFAQDFDFPTSTVWGWLVDRRGRPGGIIPTGYRDHPQLGRITYQSWIILRGRELGISYKPADFAEPAPILSQVG